ncbi:hypothetical protein Golax_021563, partial [Gossypium laxum]|nr:hypothetical protein [Gossypium laxum]
DNPTWIGNLSEIRALNLSHNNLTGPIPSTFSKLKQIESLDLSYNNLNGRIPPQLTEVTTLESCNEGDSLGTPSASSSEEEHGFIDMCDFYISFGVSYAIIFLATIISSSVALLQKKHLTPCFFNGCSSRV